MSARRSTRRHADRRIEARTSAALASPAAASAAGLDGGLLLSAGVLIGVGVVMSYSSTAPLALSNRIPPLFLRHLVALLLGLAIATLAALVPLRFWNRAAVPLWLVAVGTLVATAILGVEVNGAQRWLVMPGLDLRFQPVEPAKFATVLAVAAVIAPREGHRELSRGRTWAALAIALPPIALLIGQPDLGNAVVLALLVGLLLIAAGIPLRSLILPTLAATGGLVLYILQNPYALRRVTSFRDPWEHYHGAGFQLAQSFVAFNQGGLWGLGLGNGRQKLYYLPEAHTDFVLALVAEELGLVGALVVLGAFASLFFAGTGIARRARSRFALLLAFGATALLSVPAMVNAAVVMGLLPTKGLTLPFLSYGGTSLATCCAVLGVLFGVARHESRSQRDDAALDGAKGGPWR